jgi:hypothetical protein
MVKCECGNTNPQDFRKNRRKCVRCLSAQKAVSRLQRSPWKERCTKIANRAKTLDIDFDLTPVFIENLYKHQKGLCFYTDYPMDFSYGNGLSQHSLSIDRVNTTFGYIKDNVVLCTTQANQVKSNLTLDEIRLWLPGWFNRLQSEFDLGLDTAAPVC